MQGASQLANIGNQGLQAQQGIYGLQNQMGQQQQQNQQQIINQAMQDYANAQQYPLMQLGTMSYMLRGLPMQAQTTQQYQAQANPITQGIGAIGSLGSLAQVKAEGGAVKSMASGGITSIPRYDVGGAVVSQLATMPDEALKKEAMESPSPRVREMAAAILKQRQAGLNAEPQMEAAPAQGVGPMGVDYNANYAGGGIIAFADGKKVDAAEAARNAKQTEMYVLGAKLAAEQRRAQEADALLAAASAAPLSPGIKAAPTEEQATSVAGRLADTIGSGISSVTRGITDKWDALSAMREQNQKRAAAIPGFFESLTPTQRAERAAQEKAANEEYKKIYNNKFQPFGSKPIGDSSGFKPYVGPSGKASEISTLLQGGREPIGIDSVGTTAEKRAPVVTEKRAPVVVKEAAAPVVVTKAPPALLDRNAPPYTGAAVEAAPTGIAAVDPLADSRATLKSLQADANKTQEQIYKENLAALKAQGLDTSEARDQYMKAQQAQRAETEKSFQNREYLRKAQFFAKWGSTPGNTLVAGMSALKETIPDVIQDATEKRAALQLADKAIYELGEAVRLEKLGMWEKAAAQKLKAAETAATLQGQITQASASIEGHKISAKGTTDAAGIRAASDKETTEMTASATRYSADQRLAAEKLSSAASARATAEAAAGRLSMKQSEAINKAAKELSLLPSEIEAIHSKNPDYVAAVKAKATAERVLANNPDSAPMKAQLTNAQKVISGFTAGDNKILGEARQRLEAMEKRYYGPDYVASPAASADADPLGLRKSK
jgi:hypothetical protein